MPLPQVGQTITPDQLDSIGMPAADLVNPASSTDSGYMADIANNYWNAHPNLTAEQVLTQLPNRQANASSNQFALTVDPRTGRFIADPAMVPPELQSAGTMPAIGQTISLEQLNTLPGIVGPPQVKPPAPIGPDTSSLAYKVGAAARDVAGFVRWGDQQAGMGNDEALADINTAALTAEANIANWKKLHATNPAQPLSPQEIATAQMMQVDHPGFLASGVDALKQLVGLQGFPIVQGSDGKPTVGPTLKMPISEHDSLVSSYVKEHGGNVPAFQQRADNTLDPDKPDFDLAAALLQTHSDLAQSFLNPAYSNTVLKNTLDMVTKARQVVANPKGYSAAQVKQATGIVNYYKQHASESPLDATKQLIQSFAANPGGTVKSLIAGIASTPELALAGGAGDFGKGAQAVEAAARAERLAKVADLAGKVSAAEGAPEAAVGMAATAAKTSDAYGRAAARSMTQAKKLARRSQLAEMASGAAVGAGINAGMSYAQQTEQQGYSGNLSGPAVLGGLMGVGGAALHGNPLSKMHTLTEGTPDTRASNERVPGEPLPASTPTETNHDVTYGGGVNATLGQIHIDKDTPTALTMQNRLGQPVVVNPHETIGYHERVEANLMHPAGPAGEDGLLKVIQRMGKYRTKENMTPAIMQKIKEGVPLSYPDAHEIAQASEHHVIDTEYNIYPDVYDKALKPYLKQAAAKSESNTGIPPNTPPGIDTKPYDDMGHPEEVEGTGVSGGPTGATGGPNASHPETEQASFLSKHGNKIASAAGASGLGSLAASTLSQPGDSWKKKLELAATGALAGPALMFGLDRFGRDIVPGSDKFQKGMLFGPRSHLFDPEKANEAREMMWRGMTPEEIYEQTGVFVDPEGSLGMENTDHRMDIPAFAKTERNVPLPYNDVVHGSGFQEAYPEEAKNTKIVLDTTMPDHVLGMYSPSEKTVYVNARKVLPSVLDTLTHENQHIVQEIEGWAQGSGPKTFLEFFTQKKFDLWEEYKIAKSEAQTHLANGRPEQAQEAAVRATDLRNDPLFDADQNELELLANRTYRDTYGEGLANTSMNRRRMFPRDRAASFPQVDIPEGSRVFLHGQNMDIFHEEPEESLAEHMLNAGDVEDDGHLIGAENIGNKIPHETELVDRARQGDAPAITLLYKHYYPMMVNTIRGMLDGKTRLRLEGALAKQPEDIAQEAFQKALRALPTFEGRSSFYTYLHAITRNSVLTAIRDAGRRPETSSLYRPGTDLNERTPSVSMGHGTDVGKGRNMLSAEGEQLSSEEPTPIEALENEEQDQRSQQVSDAVHEVLDKMSEPFRQAIIDHEFNGMSYADMAKAAGLTEGAMRARVAKAHTIFKYSMAKGHGASYLRQGGFATPEAVKKLFQYGVLPFTGATVGMYVSSPEHKLRGAILGAIAGMLSARMDPVGYVRNLKYILDHPNQPDIRILTAGYEGVHNGILRDSFQTWDRIRKLVPDASRRSALAHVVEGTSKEKLTPNEQQAVTLAKDFMKRTGEAGIASGALKKLLPNFLNHEWTSDVGDWTKHNLHRVYASYATGMAQGLTPKTLDLAELMHLYGRDMARAIATKHLQAGLREFDMDLDGNKAIMPSNTAPHNYRQVDHPALQGMSVHPAIVDPLSFIYSRPYGQASQALAVLISGTKRSKLGMSLFHPFNLALVHLATQPWLSDGGGLRAFKEIGQSVVGRTQMHQMYREGGYGDMVHLAMRSGLRITHLGKGDVIDADMNNGFYQGLESFEDWVRKYPLFGSLAGKAVHVVGDINHLEDKFLWEGMHTGLKLQHFQYSFDTAKMNYLRKATADPKFQVPADLEIARDVANYVNDAYGGLNWRQTVEDATTRFGRLLAATMNAPNLRMVMQTAVFALDWTESTLRMFFRSFGHGNGFEGLVHPKTSTDFARLYMLKNAVMVGTLYNAVNMATVGHPIWENKDPDGNPEPFDIQLGNGESIQPNKHFFEAPNLLWDTTKPLWQNGASPFQWEMNKVGQLPQELIEQGLGIDYLSPNAPKMHGRLAHLGNQFVPISASTFHDKGKLAAFLSMFMQVSHKTKAGRVRARRERSSAAFINQINEQ